MAAQRSDGSGDDASHRPTVLEPSPFSPKRPDGGGSSSGTIIGGVAGFDRRQAHASTRVTERGPGAAVTVRTPERPVASPKRRASVDANREVSRGGTTVLGKSFFDRGDDPRFGHDKPDPEFDAAFAPQPSFFARCWHWMRGARTSRTR